MKSTRAVLATILFFPLTLFAQHGATASSSAGSSSASHSSPASSSSVSHSSPSSAPSSHASGGSHTSSGSPASRGSSSGHSGSGSPTSTIQHKGTEVSNSKNGQSRKNDIVQSKDDKGKAKPEASTADKDHGGKEHARRSWLPWKRHADDTAKKGDHKEREDKKEKCKPGKPCRSEVRVAQVDEDKVKCIHGPCKVCPPGYSLNKKGACMSAPQNTGYNCPPGTIRAGQSAGQPCGSNLSQNNCSVLADQIQRQELELQRIQSARRAACSQGPSNQECLDLESEYDLEALRLEQLRREYDACLRR